MTHMFNKKIPNSGFTLIEVLVVFMIAGAVISLVGPNLFNAYRGTRASAEEQKMIDIIKTVRMKAFLRKMPYAIQFEENTLEVKDEGVRFEFEFLRFPHSRIAFNSNGFPDRRKLSYAILEENRIFDIRS